MIKRTILAATAVAAASFADATTTVAVMEFGKGGSVRRTNSANTSSSVSGVASFWSAMHSPNRGLQYAGMNVVPDLFNKAESGVIVGLMGSGLDLASMPTVSNIVQGEGQGVIGHMEIKGEKGAALLKKAPTKAFSTENLSSVQAENGAQAFKVDVNDFNAAKVDAQVDSLMKSLKKQAESSGKTVVLHLVVEEEEGAARRRALARRLNEDEESGEENNNGEEGEEEGQSAYYGYGYWNNGVWVTNYKTIFQIQYFNIVLWTSIGLVIILGYSTYLMVYMPLMADTLLFGESAKMMGE